MNTIETLLGDQAEAQPPTADARSSYASRYRAISAGSSSVMPNFTRRNTAGSRRSRAFARRSSPISSTTTIQNVSAAGSPKSNGEKVGTVMLVKDSADVARIRLLWLEPKARGIGLGARLIDECIRFARRAGYKKITLWTHSVLSAARHIYQKAGFKLMRTERHRSWGKPVVSEHWDLSSVRPPLRRGLHGTSAVAPFALGRRKCSSRRGMISTKLHGW